MTHDEFIKAYKNQTIIVKVHKNMAMRLMDYPGIKKTNRAAHLFWTWVWFLSIPAAIACFIFFRWWVGLIVLLVGFALPRAIKDSATEFVIEQALEDERFYNLAVELKALLIEEK